MARIVGWHLEPREEEPCVCGNPSTVAVLEEDEMTYSSVCDDCVPPGTHDAVAEVFARIFTDES